MGAYINPENCTKEEFLAKEGIPLSKEELDKIPEKFLPVCLIDNIIFSAAAILYSPRELQEFTNPSDPRPKRFFAVEVGKLLQVSPELKRYLK